MDDEEDNIVEYMNPELIAARDELGRAISSYLALARPTQSPVILAWVIGAEWTTTDLEQSGQAGRIVIPHHDQTISATVGLGHLILNNF